MNVQCSFLVCQKKPDRWFFNLRHTLQFGIGLHHAGLNDKDRSLVEEQDSGISGTEYYDGKTKRDVDFPISITDRLQMMAFLPYNQQLLRFYKKDGSRFPSQSAGA
ncbi:unnamed protein product [Prunus armeniaca]